MTINQEAVQVQRAKGWAAEFAGWIQHGPNATRRDWYVEVICGKAVLCLPGWESYHVQEITRGLRERYGITLKVGGSEAEPRIFHKPEAPTFGHFARKMRFQVA